ncbi:MAG: GNAT family N-acetyltransferase [Thermoplasmata archaeon]
MEQGVERFQKLRSWLDREPVRYAHVVHLLSLPADDIRILVDDERRPRGVLGLRPETQRLVAAAEPAERLEDLLDSLPSGKFRLTSIDRELVPYFESALEVRFRTPVWLYQLSADHLRPSRAAQTRPLEASEAPMIAALWAPERNATAYVRRRIEGGISSGIEVDGELVAWDMTHFETDRVVMLGFLHVREAHRGQGYAKAVTTATAEKVFAKGKTAAAQVFEDNLPSLRLTEGMGFRRVRRQVWGDGIKA